MWKGGREINEDQGEEREKGNEQENWKKREIKANEREGGEKMRHRRL